MLSNGFEKALQILRALMDEAGVPCQVCSVGSTQTARLRLGNGASLYMGYFPGLALFQLPAVRMQLLRDADDTDHVGLCVGQITLSLLEACKADNLALFDLQGNAYVKVPGLYIERIRPRQKLATEATSGTVFTAKASRVVRVLLKHYRSFQRQSNLVKSTGLSPGYVSTLCKRLVAHGYLADNFGELRLIDPDQLLDDWLAHYRIDRHHRMRYAISARTYEEGLQKLHDVLQGAQIQFAWTGWSGGQIRAPFSIPSVYNAYVSAPPGDRPGLFPAGQGEGNVSLYIPQDEGVFQCTTDTAYGPVVSDEQLYLDLRRIPGRGKEQADAVRHRRLNYTRGLTR